jgi:hypothetical protein
MAATVAAEPSHGDSNCRWSEFLSRCLLRHPTPTILLNADHWNLPLLASWNEDAPREGSVLPTTLKNHALKQEQILLGLILHLENLN